MRRSPGLLGLTVMSLLMLCAPVHANPIEIDVLIPNNLGGSVSYAGGANPLVGAHIGSHPGSSVLQFVNFSSTTSANAGLCINCSIDFTTGAHSSNATVGGVPTYFFNGGGTFTITGGVDKNLNKVLDPSDISQRTLMTGTFTNSEVDVTGPGNKKVNISTVITSIDPALLHFLGLPSAVYSGVFHLDFSASTTPFHSFRSSTVGSGDFNQSPPVPEPGTVLLLGSGLLGFGYLSRRRVK
jgi:hypothetical protein